MRICERVSADGSGITRISELVRDTLAGCSVKEKDIEKAEIPKKPLEGLEDGELIQERKDIHILLRKIILLPKGLDFSIEDHSERVLLEEGIM